MSSQTVHLLTDSAIYVQQMSLQLVEQAAAKHTEHLVIEAGVDTEQEVVVKIPEELVEILMRLLPVESTLQDAVRNCSQLSSFIY